MTPMWIRRANRQYGSCKQYIFFLSFISSLFLSFILPPPPPPATVSKFLLARKIFIKISKKRNSLAFHLSFSFSNLFSTSEKPQRKPLPYGNVRYSPPTHQVTPALETMRQKKLSDHRRKGLEIFDAEL